MLDGSLEPENNGKLPGALQLRELRKGSCGEKGEVLELSAAGCKVGEGEASSGGYAKQ